MSKQYALRSIHGEGYVQHLEYFQGITPYIVRELVQTPKEAFLMTESSLDIVRNGSSTKELILEHLSDFELVEINFKSIDSNDIRKFNLNSEVKVKLTNFGVQVLRDKHNEVFKDQIERGNEEFGFKLELDGEGYYKAQMWKIMHTFGEYIHDTTPSREVFSNITFLIPKNNNQMCL